MLSPPVVIRQDVAETGFKFFVERAREHRVEPVAGPAPLRCLRGADRPGLYEFQTLQRPRFTDPLDGPRPGGSLSGWPVRGRWLGNSAGIRIRSLILPPLVASFWCKGLIAHSRSKGLSRHAPYPPITPRCFFSGKTFGTARLLTQASGRVILRL
jgi:hypothetical protein